MSALTDLFSALANKIRSKTGGSDTYTPLEMVNSGIDDVYDAGVEAGTPTLTGDATASDVKSGKTFYGSTLTKQTGTFAADTVNNSATATTSQATKSPASGKYFANFTINPQQHSETYTPAANTSNNDMGAVHNKRYVNTSGMIVPSGAKSITANGTGIDVSSYATANVSVPNPTLSGDAAVGNVLSGKTFYSNSYTKRTGTMANRGAFEGDVDPSVSTPYALSPGYYSSIELSVLPHTGYSPSSSTYTQLAMGEAKSIDLGQYHKYRYVRVEADAPSGTKSISANGTGIDVTSYASVNVSVPNPTLSGDAAVGNVLSGKTFYNSDYTKRTGTMTNQGPWTSTGNVCNASTVKDVTIPAGYHNGSGYVRFNSLASQTGVDSGKTAIDASHVHSGYQGWVNGSKVSGTYTPPTITSLAPSDSNPPTLETTKNYNPTTGGYAIASYQSKAPSASGTQFDEGFVKMSDGGYAYTEKPSKTETSLWTNSSPTSNFAEQTITLSQAFTNFDLIKIEYQASISKTTKGYVYVDKTTLQQSLWSDPSKPLVSISGRNNNATASTQYVRRFMYVSDTQLTITAAYQVNANSSATNSTIPTKITGIKFSGITF